MRDARVWRALHAWPNGGGGGGGSGGGGGAEALVYSGAHLPCFPFWLLLQPWPAASLKETLYSPIFRAPC